MKNKQRTKKEENKDNAIERIEELKKKGFDAFIMKT